ncbi:Protein of unknown function [Lactobacillus delbrueckii subsp. bulgaricus]|nr:Protein of unknown function [Lactobacillus delbrueckii subsp. bulgaricus]
MTTKEEIKLEEQYSEKYKTLLPWLRINIPDPS